MDFRDISGPVFSEKLAISSMWEMALLVGVLERKGVLTRQEICDAIHELRQRHPEATMSEQPRSTYTSQR